MDPQNNFNPQPTNPQPDEPAPQPAQPQSFEPQQPSAQPIAPPQPTEQQFNPIQPATPSQPPLAPDAMTTWPGAFGLYKYSKQAVKTNLGTILTLALLSFVISLGLGLLHLPGRILSQLISLVFSVASINIYLAGVRGQKLGLEQALKKCQPMVVLKYLVSSILLAIVLGVSFVLLIVPFFFVLPRLILSPLFLIDQKLGPIAALSTSWRVTAGHAGKIWGILGAVFVMALPVFTIIGIPFTIYFVFMYGAATTLAYNFIVRANPTTSSTPTPMAPTALDTPAPTV